VSGPERLERLDLGPVRGFQQLDPGAQPFVQLAFALQKLVVSHATQIETQKAAGGKRRQEGGGTYAADQWAAFRARGRA
jgi:hypothetical protein